MPTATSQLPANDEQFPTTPATVLASSGSKADTRSNESLKSNPTLSANKRKREPVGGGDINDNKEKKSDGDDDDDNNVESSEGGIKEVEMKDAEIDGSGGIKEVEMQDATEVQEKNTIREEDHNGKVNKDDYIRSNLNATEVCKQNQTTDKLSECNDKQIEGVICDDEGKVNKDDYVRSNLNETDGFKQNQTTDKSECNEKEIKVGASGQRVLGEVATLLKEVQETSEEKAKLEVDIKVMKKKDDNGDTDENGNDNDQKVTRVSCP